MPKLRSHRPDWSTADAMFARQVGRLLGETGMTRDALAVLLHISEQTLRAHLRKPGMVTKEEERRLYLVCREHGINYTSALEEVRFS